MCDGSLIFFIRKMAKIISGTIAKISYMITSIYSPKMMLFEHIQLRVDVDRFLKLKNKT